MSKEIIKRLKLLKTFGVDFVVIDKVSIEDLDDEIRNEYIQKYILDDIDRLSDYDWHVEDAVKNGLDIINCIEKKYGSELITLCSLCTFFGKPHHVVKLAKSSDTTSDIISLCTKCSKITSDSNIFMSEVLPKTVIGYQFPTGSQIIARIIEDKLANNISLHESSNKKDVYKYIDEVIDDINIKCKPVIVSNIVVFCEYIAAAAGDTSHCSEPTKYILYVIKRVMHHMINLDNCWKESMSIWFNKIVVQRARTTTNFDMFLKFIYDMRNEKFKKIKLDDFKTIQRVGKKYGFYL